MPGSLDSAGLVAVPARPPSIVVADDQPVMVEGLTQLLRTNFEILGTATDGSTLLELVQRLSPQLVLFELAMPGLSGVELVQRLSKLRTPPIILVLTMQSDANLAAESLHSGASAYLLKTAP